MCNALEDTREARMRVTESQQGELARLKAERDRLEVAISVMRDTLKLAGPAYLALAEKALEKLETKALSAGGVEWAASTRLSNTAKNAISQATKLAQHPAMRGFRRWKMPATSR